MLKSFTVTRNPEESTQITLSLETENEATKLHRIFTAEKSRSASNAENRLNYSSKAEGSTLTVEGDFNAIFSVLSNLANGRHTVPTQQLVSKDVANKLRQLWVDSSRATGSKGALFTSDTNMYSPLETSIVAPSTAEIPTYS